MTLGQAVAQLVAAAVCLLGFAVALAAVQQSWAVLWITLAVIVAGVLALWAAVVGGTRLARWAGRQRNHRFVDESTDNRIIVARYNRRGVRDLVLDVPTDQHLWLTYQVDIMEAEICLWAAEPTIRMGFLGMEVSGVDEPVWAEHAEFRGYENYREAAGQAFRAAKDAGQLTSHINLDTWMTDAGYPKDARVAYHDGYNVLRAPEADPGTA